ncbi:CatB-related O-acetyltransferase [Marinobacter sp. W-8]|uniref:CatB-related O-acetyltransferase n=1 Tax=Marinobacter sp. W-8 TaxID=3369658 RepID=UPI0037C570FD
MLISEKKHRFFTNSLDASSVIASEFDLSSVFLNNKSKSIFFEKAVRFASELMVGKKGVFLGAHSYMNGGGYVTDNTFIGRYCSIGRRVSLGAGLHRLNTVSSFPFRHYTSASPYTRDDALYIPESRKFSDETIIGNDVWIGDGSVIIKGIQVGTGAVIGANSVITKDIPPYAIVGGSPSKLIRYRFDADIREKLLGSEWWESDRLDLESLPLLNVYEFLESYASEKFSDANFSTYLIN